VSADTPSGEQPPPDQETEREEEAPESEGPGEAVREPRAAGGRSKARPSGQRTRQRAPAAPPQDAEEPEEPVDEFVVERIFPSGNRVLAWGFLAAVTLIALSLFWSACETHYRGCVEAVDVKTRGANGPLDRLTRQEGVKNCTRSPFGD
jgi:hypothetical protein